MISSQQALNETIRILKEHLSNVSGETGGSHAYGFYQLAQNIFVKFRVADHGLYMQTFVSHDNGVAPELVSIISVVYRESPKEPIGTKWKTNGYPNSIVVYQYVYPCWDMDFNDIPPIAFELITFAKTNTFVPPHLCTKDVKVQEITSDIGIRDVTNKLRARYCSVNESKINKNMNKNVIKLNESQLKDVIAKAVKNVIKEDMNHIDAAQQFIDNEEYAKQFLNWVFDGEGSRTGIMQDIWGYYDAKVHHNESNAQWYFDEVLRIYADGIGREESELNVPAIEKAINYWGAYNYTEDTDETEIQENKKSVKLKESQLRKVVSKSIKKILKEDYDSFIEDTIGKELSEMEDCISAISGKLGTDNKWDGAVPALNGHSSSMQERQAYEAIRMIKRGLNTLRNCTNAY